MARRRTWGATALVATCVVACSRTPPAPAARDAGPVAAAAPRADASVGRPLAADAAALAEDSIEQIAASGGFLCHVTRGGRVACRGAAPSAASLVAALADIHDGLEVEIGPALGCVRHGRGEVACWRWDGSAGPAGGLAAVEGVSRARQVSVGGEHACAVTRRGEVRCWGANDSGQLGEGAGGASARAVEVAGLGVVEEVAAGFRHTCAREGVGSVWCWGRDVDGELGDTLGGDRPVPAPVEGLIDAVRLASGASSTLTCALRSTGEVVCWGAAGLPGSSEPAVAVGATPVPLAPVPDLYRIAVGDSWVCGLASTQQVACWSLTEEAFARGEAPAAFGLPYLVEGRGRILEVDVGSQESCLRLASGEVWCDAGRDRVLFQPR